MGCNCIPLTMGGLGKPSLLRGRTSDPKRLLGALATCLPCHAGTGQLVNVKIIRNKNTAVSEGYGFVEFATHEAAEQVLRTFNGWPIPNTDQIFRLNWAAFGVGKVTTDCKPPFLLVPTKSPCTETCLRASRFNGRARTPLKSTSSQAWVCQCSLQDFATVKAPCAELRRKISWVLQCSNGQGESCGLKNAINLCSGLLRFCWRPCT